MHYTYRDSFPCSKQFLNSSILMPFSAVSVFCFTSSTLAKHFPLGTSSSRETKTKKSCLGQDWLNRGGKGWRGVMLFLVKICWTLSLVWAGVLINHPHEIKHVERVFQKNSLKPNTTSHNNASNTDGFLEHSPSRGSLYYKGPASSR